MPEQTTSSTPEHVHETFDTNIRPIVATTAVLFIFTAFLCLALFVVLIFLKNRSAATDTTPNPVELGVAPPPEPRLQPSPPHPNLDSQDLVQMRDSEDKRLNHYSRDPKTGEIHIPVSRAMELLLQQQAKQPSSAVGVAKMRKTTIAALMLLLAPLAMAQSQSPAIPSPEVLKDDMGQGAYASQQTPVILRQVGIDQKLGDQLPLDVQLHDESGKTVLLGDYFNHGKPVLILPVYFRCPMLCTMELNSLLVNLKLLQFTAGKEFEIVTFSFDPRETPEIAADKKKNYIREYHRQGAENGWHFLTADQENIKKLTAAIGFRYAYDKAADQYAHASGLMLATPQGKLSRYYYGVTFDARDLRLGMVEASDEKIGTLADAVMLYCFHYDPTQGKYGLVIMNIVRAGGVLTLAGVGTMLFFLTRRAKVNMSRMNPQPLTH